MPNWNPDAPNDLGLYGPEGAWWPASLWLTAVLDSEDWAGAWAVCDKSYRLFTARKTLAASRDHPALAGADLEALCTEWSAADRPIGAPWALFAAAAVAAIQDRLGQYGRPGAWAVTSAPRLVAADLEIVYFLPTVAGGTLLPEGPLDAPVVPFLMRWSDGQWRVANALSVDATPV